ncbi:MAG: ComEC/Rec2 family competence protein [Candidatus Saccharimonadales bacterium]
MQMWQLKRKVHPSWLIALASAGIVTGTAIIPLINQTIFNSVAWLLIAVAMAAFVMWRRLIILLPVIIIAGFLIGLWRGSVLETQLTVYENLTGHIVQITGRISDDPDSGKQQEMLLRLSDVRINNHAVAGKIWVSSARAGDIKRGDFVEINGVLQEGFGSFAAAIYRAKILSVERPEPGDVARQARDWFGYNVQMAIKEPEASLGLGYLLGQKRALPDDLQQALVATGLTHVVVASGYNLTILVRLARRLFVKVSKYLATLSSSTMIVAFIAITGASPSMSRAGLVSGLSLAAWYYGRKFHPLVLLPFIASVTVLIDPTYAWNDLGWQLSFAAFGGVMILAPLLQAYFFGDKKPGIIRQILGETISASIVTLPILVIAFGQFSNVALLTNLLILPFVPLAMLLTFIAGIGAVIVPLFASIFGLPAQWLLTYMVNVIHYFANLSWAQTVIEIQPWMVWAAYIVIIAVCIYLQRVTKYNLRDANVVE